MSTVLIIAAAVVIVILAIVLYFQVRKNNQTVAIRNLDRPIKVLHAIKHEHPSRISISVVDVHGDLQFFTGKAEEDTPLYHLYLLCSDTTNEKFEVFNTTSKKIT